MNATTNNNNSKPITEEENEPAKQVTDKTIVKKSSIVYIRYRDHVLFRNTKANLYRPVVREAVGWIVKENDEAVWILWDRGMHKLPHERGLTAESGLVILKSEILEMRRLGEELNTVCFQLGKCRVCVPKGGAKNLAKS